MHDFNIYDIFKRNASLYPHSKALVFEGLYLTCDELLQQVNGLAESFEEQGIGKGDRIAILAHNNYQFFILFGAASALGAVLVPLNWRLSENEIQYILEDSSPKILVADDHMGEELRKNVKIKMPEMEVIDIDSENPDNFFMDDLINPESDFVQTEFVGTDDPFCIIYTAAVQGKPRGAVLSHGNFIFGNMQTIAEMGLTCDDVYLNMLPLFHITGLNLALSVMHAGGKNVIIEKFDEKLTIEQTEKEKVSLWGSFPPILSRILAELDNTKADISSLRQVLGIDSPENIELFEKKTGAVFWILYGQTETSGLAAFSPSSKKPGSAGTPGLLTKVKIVDENNNQVPAGQTGEIAVQGPLVFQGFWNQGKPDKKTIKGSWHYTGDTGAMDEESFLWFKGRKPEKELIKPGGENVYPAEVEAVILEHPAVADVSVIGVPDPKFGEGIKAVCLLHPGKSLKPGELSEFVASKIARYKKPGYVEFVKQIPKKPDGQTDRDKVKELYGK
ncbi:AMP binding domains-containing protein [Desulfonema limicola]|uniref:AMP binding domains-containing protein n=1 Tax=Desulfonema limicola TaxID=45656 RepID=A0A975BB45_9BACT|nr:AMP-binding protein [Desulfonema limicola]QTA82098.1 AMP binding domains-containing protein [Desulfonema limicola]